jgi:outer membrane protein OmpA-like peptidoglycan-associated protein
MKKQNILLIAALAVVVMMASSCGSADGEFTGSEYMPDMGHSIAYEINTSNYYHLNQYTEDSNYHKMVMPRKPVAGTMPRGAAGLASVNAEALKADMMGLPTNGYMPYYYEDTEADRARAMADMTSNPVNLTDAGLARGKELYEVYCGICHGEKADGNGYLVRDAVPAKGDLGGKYPAQPTNLTSDEFKAASEGRFYHAIMYGKNVMGSYKDKLSYEERWQVIHHIRKLQFGDDYDPLAVTAAFDSNTVSQVINEVISTGNASSQALVLNNVFFETGKNELESGSKAELDLLANILKENPKVKIQINGHTDNVGDAAKNQKLSEKRAKAVMDYLIAAGIEADRLSFKGFGDTDPTASNDSPDGRQKNRRTDFIILN